jgi:hypothetical protein
MEAADMSDKGIAEVLATLVRFENTGATLQQQLLYIMEELRGEERADRVHVAIVGCHSPERTLTIRALTMLRDELKVEWQRQQSAERASVL